jgi:hypothetical protein
MQDLSGLNSLYAEYRQGTLGKRELEEMMFKIMLKSVQDARIFDDDEEASIDYLCWLYPRLSRAIQNYRENGATFATYINALIRYSLREYRSRQYDHYLTEYAAWTAHTTDMEARSPGPPYPGIEEEELRSRPAPRTVLKSRQVLMLILKSYYFMSEDLIDRIAPMTGLTAERLRKMIEKLRDRRSRREEDRRLTQERITTQFYRCIVWEKRLKAMLPGTVRYEQIQIQLGRARKRLAGMRKRLARIKVNASHRQVAEILGISVGAVGSSLSMLKSHWGLDAEGRPVRKDRNAGTRTPKEQGPKEQGPKEQGPKGRKAGASPRVPPPQAEGGGPGGEAANAGGDTGTDCGVSCGEP